MLVVAKWLSCFLQSRHIQILVFWSVTSFTFFALALYFGISNTETPMVQLRVYQDPFAITALILAPAICLLLFSRSIPIIFSVSLSTILTYTIFSFSTHCCAILNSHPVYLVIVCHVATANAIFIRRCWDKYRRAPCSSTIHRLLLATIDKSLPQIVATTCCASMIPVAFLLPSTQKLAPIYLALFATSLLQNTVIFSSILAFLLLRNTFVWWIPSLKTNSIARTFQAFVEEKLVYIAHFMCKIGKKLLSSKIKIPVVLFYLFVILSFLSFQTFLFAKYVNDFTKNGDFECAYSNCYQPIVISLSLFIVPPVFFFVSNRLQINTIISIIGFTFNAISIQMFKKLLESHDMSPMEIMMLSVISADGTLRYCSAYRFSRKKTHEAKVLDTVDTLFAQITLSTISTFASLLFLHFYVQKSAYTYLVFLALGLNWITVIIFYPSAISVTGPITFGKKRRGSQASETRSLNTERFSSHLMIDNQEYTKKYSTSNYYGAGTNKQKRSYNVLITDSRRASMPVSMHNITIPDNAPVLKKKSWATAGCFSVDGVITMTPREVLQIMRKEDSITSDNILIKEIALI